MTKSYDKHYRIKKYFGEPYPELISFFRNFPVRGKLLDLGCGQGRNAIPLAQFGYNVTGIDSSKIGINQMLKLDNRLELLGIVGNIYEVDNFYDYEFILLDSMFHFHKKDIARETKLVKKIIALSKSDTIIVFCIRDSGDKVRILNKSIDYKYQQKRVLDKKIKYKFEYDGKPSESDYKIIAILK